MAASPRDVEQIETLLETYRRGFAALDVGLLESIWDTEYAPIVYVAQELAQPVRDGRPSRATTIG